MKKLLNIVWICGIFLIILIILSFGASLSNAALLAQTTGQGGTGTTTPSGILYGSNSSTTPLRTVTVGTGLTFSGGTLSASAGGTVSTSSVPTIGQLSYWTSAGYPSLLGTVATTSLTATSPLSLSNAISVIGGSASALSISTAGTWSGNAGTATALAANGANCSSGSFPLGVDASGAVESCTVATTGTVTSIATTYPITGGTITTTGTLGIAFGTTTANTWADTQTFTKAITISEGTTATSTFNGNIWVKGNTQLDGLVFANVTLTQSGNVRIENLNVTGTVDLDTFTSAILLTGAGGDVAEYTGASCTNQFIRSLSALGASTCATVGAADVSLANLTATDSTLTFSGTYTGATARTIGLNLGNANTWTALQTFGNASTTQIGSTGSAYFATASGNVGIGTTAPKNTLDVRSANRLTDHDVNGVQIAAYSTDSQAIDKGGQIVLGGMNGSAGVYDPYTFGSIAGRKENGTSGNFAGYLQFSTTVSGGPITEKVRITSTGNVGIGTTGPGYKLDVNGIVSTAAAGSGGFYFGARGSITQDASYNWLFTTNGVANVMSIQSSTGNVGIATTSPWRTLSVTGTVAISGLTTESGTGNVLCVKAGGEIVQDDSPITACSGASTIKVKDNVFGLDPKKSLADILEMRPVSYQYKPTYSKDQSEQLGFIAEEIDKIEPRLVEYQDGEPSGLKYATFVASLVSAMQEQQAQIEKLEARITALEGKQNACYAK